MATYTVKPNQNLYDVALHLYGSIEGLFDLLISNPQLNMSTDLQFGQELEYHSEFVINPSIVSSFDTQKIIPSGGTRHIYFKKIEEDLLMLIGVNADMNFTSFKASGEGFMLIDWGDNSELQTVELGADTQIVEHYFDNEVEKRRIKIYGNNATLKFTLLDTTELRGALVLCRPIVVDVYVCVGRGYSLSGLALFEDTFSVDLHEGVIDNLLPIANMNLQTLNLTDVHYIKDCVLDDYLVFIREHYNDRPPCTVYLTTEPSEIGYQAIDTILNESEWNVSGAWKFYINEQLYTPQYGSNS